MDKVRERIKEYITKGVIKTEGLRKLKREFKIDSDKLSSMWLEEKENIKQKHSKTSKKKIKNEEVKNVEGVRKPKTVDIKKKDHIAEVSKKVDELEVLEEEVIKSIKVKGRNGVYQAKTGLGVALENGEYKLAFSNVEEVEEFCNEFKKVFERI